MFIIEDTFKYHSDFCRFVYFLTSKQNIMSTNVTSHILSNLFINYSKSIEAINHKLRVFFQKFGI